MENPRFSELFRIVSKKLAKTKKHRFMIKANKSLSKLRVKAVENTIFSCLLWAMRQGIMDGISLWGK